ncbi:hypothetical protein AYI68_g8325 [Smittium mucronatum]|uniref:Uncharacterized protein n=1 Tax=Smittium mucronatum TaxID=133383 RepID=A0A1R0GL75_9FUNG|nr:hypothetical protein AYI68_g8325 [Smittium mucronatum]
MSANKIFSAFACTNYFRTALSIRKGSRSCLRFKSSSTFAPPGKDGDSSETPDLVPGQKKESQSLEKLLIYLESKGVDTTRPMKSYYDFTGIDPDSPISIDLSQILKFNSSSDSSQKESGRHRAELSRIVKDTFVFDFPNTTSHKTATHVSESSNTNSNLDPNAEFNPNHSAKSNTNLEAPSYHENKIKSFREKEKDELVQKELNKFISEIDSLWLDVPKDTYRNVLTDHLEYNTPYVIPGPESKKPEIDDLDLDKMSNKQLQDLLLSQVLHILRHQKN